MNHIQRQIDLNRCKSLAEYAAKFGTDGPPPDSEEVANGLKRVLDIPRGGVRVAPEPVVEVSDELGASDEPSKRAWNETYQEICEKVERSARRKKSRRRADRAAGRY